jgi:hypothetical protein
VERMHVNQQGLDMVDPCLEQNKPSWNLFSLKGLGSAGLSHCTITSGAGVIGGWQQRAVAKPEKPHRSSKESKSASCHLTR